MIMSQSQVTKNKEIIEISKASSTSLSSAVMSWSRLRDPRIVRVSRVFGGKDRHSKVFTVRGLRDRRVRLSIPTAIQLYDLQDRLGLSQPSKVVDWLLKAAKHGIDELPPLQIPPGFFNQHLTQIKNQSAKHGLKIRDRFKDSSPGQSSSVNKTEAADLARNPNEETSQGEFFASTTNPYSFPGWYNPFVTPNLALIYPPQTQGFTPQPNQDSGDLPSSGSHQVLVYHQHGITTQPYFPPQVSNSMLSAFDSKETSYLQSTSSLPALPVYHFTTQPAAVRTVAFGTTLGDLHPLLQKHTENHEQGRSGNNDFPSLGM